MEFIWTQSALKDFEKDTTCPKRWESQWILKEFKSAPSEAQSNGNNFELLCIGKNAKSDTELDIKTTKSGEKTALQKRMEYQAEKFNHFFDPTHTDFLGYNIVDVQVKLANTIGGIQIEGTADILAETADKTRYPVIIDIKSTEDAYSTRTEFGWGNPIEDLDLIQQILYQYLYFRSNGVKPKMVLLIFELGTKLRVRVLEIEISDDRYDEMVNRFTTAQSVKEQYTKVGYSRIPSEKECEKCPLTCAKRLVSNTTIKEVVKY